MHPIQSKIVKLLMHTSVQTYAQLRPEGVESNHFAYHLDQLVKDGLVAKLDRGYTLTSAGLAHADRVSHETMAVRVQPHLVTTVVITNDTGQTLLFRHTFQPYLDKVGVPQGRIHYGELVAEAASRELEEKTSLKGIELTHRGIVYITTTKHGVDISRFLTHVFSGAAHGAPDVHTEKAADGVPFWGDAASYSPAQCMPGFPDIQRLLRESTGLFFAELTAEMA